MWLGSPDLEIPTQMVSTADAISHLLPLILVTGDCVSSWEILFTKALGSHSWKERAL